MKLLSSLASIMFLFFSTCLGLIVYYQVLLALNLPTWVWVLWIASVVFMCIGLMFSFIAGACSKED